MKNLLKYIAVFGALTLGVFLNVENVNGQCTNTYHHGSAVAPTDNVTINISTSQAIQDYAIVSNIVAGETYRITFDRGNSQITVRSGTYNGPLVANGSGLTTLNFTAAVSGDHFIHFNDNDCYSSPWAYSYTTTITCISCSPPTPQDCEGATMVCSNNSFSGNSSGYNIQELDDITKGCLNTYEHQSSWYYVNVSSSGTLEMAISPDNGTDDYDWAIWGPFDAVTAAANCSPINSPIKCSYAEGGTDTGMGSGIGCTGRDYWDECVVEGTVTGTGDSESQLGDGWVAPLNVTAGEIYILLIDNYTGSYSPFHLSWGGTAGLACVEVELPVELTSFTGENKKTVNQLAWETETETNNDYFIIEHSSDGFSWYELDKIPGAGSSTAPKNYTLEHRDFPEKVNYYRLTQVDFNGHREVFPVISINNVENRTLVKRLNTMGQEVSASYKGIVIEYYDDNSVEKKIY